MLLNIWKPMGKLSVFWQAKTGRFRVRQKPSGDIRFFLLRIGMGTGCLTSSSIRYGERCCGTKISEPAPNRNCQQPNRLKWSGKEKRQNQCGTGGIQRVKNWLRSGEARFKRLT